MILFVLLKLTGCGFLNNSHRVRAFYMKIDVEFPFSLCLSLRNSMIFVAFRNIVNYNLRVPYLATVIKKVREKEIQTITVTSVLIDYRNVSLYITVSSL